jgi:hypothetical protein
VASRADIERIATFIARGDQNDNPHEAEAAIRSAYARMKRDGVTLDDVLGLPDQLLYQRGLMTLVDHMVQGETGLSEPAKRDLYAKLSAKVSRRFSGEAESDATGRSSGEQGRGGERDSSKSSSTRQKTAERDTASREPFAFNGGVFKERIAVLFSKEGAVAFAGNFFSICAGAFSHGGILWHAIRSPGRAGRLLALASLFGFGLGLAFLLVAASLHSWLGMGAPWIDMNFKTAWVLIGVPLALWKIVDFYRRGWFG